MTSGVVIGVCLIIVSLARDLLSLAADAIAIMGALETRLPLVDVVFSAPVRLVLLATGILLIGKSASATFALSQDDLSEQGFRSSVGSSLESVLADGGSALDSVPEYAIPGRVNRMLWWLVRGHYHIGVEAALRRFKVISRATPELYRAEGAACYGQILELAEATKSVLGGRTDVTEELRLWFRRLDLLDAEMRRHLGADRVDKARALASRNAQVRDST